MFWEKNPMHFKPLSEWFSRKISEDLTNCWQRLKMAMDKVLVIYLTGITILKDLWWRT